MQIANERQDVVDILNSLLRTERAAVENLELVEKGVRWSALREPLDVCVRQHRQRVQSLWRRIIDLGGKPSQGSGAWGFVTRIIENGALGLGDTPAIAALEEFAHHDAERYRDAIPVVDLDTGNFLETVLLPAQERSYQTLRSLHEDLVERASGSHW